MYERHSESGKGECREFIRGKHMLEVINSTELRLSGLELGKIGAFRAHARGDANAPKKWGPGFLSTLKPMRLLGAATQPPSRALSH